jgi:hypothetical protein
MASQIIYIVYSNSTSLLGQVAYGIRRMSASTTGTPCAALELTHGGLNSKERPEWLEYKTKIPIDLQQQHYDEIPEDVSLKSILGNTLTPSPHAKLSRTQLKSFIENNRYGYPCVVGKTTNGRFHMLFADSEVNDFAHSPRKFVNTLQTRSMQAGLIWK